MIDFFQQIGGFIMAPLYYAISFVLVLFHRRVEQLHAARPAACRGRCRSSASPWSIRAALIPLFVKQIKSSRNMQLIQPKVKELQKKYGHDRERLAQETMKLYKDSGTNPFASCLPILLQMPIFFALFSILNNASKEVPKGVLTETQAEQFGEAELLGVPLSQTFIGADGAVNVMVMAAFLVLAMTATTFLTQRQLMSKNMPADALTGPYAQQQKFLLFVLPLVFAVGGIAFPIGVLLYWTTSNLWTMGQQFYVIRNNPAPGTPAFAAKEQRDAAKAARHGTSVPEAGTEAGATNGRRGTPVAARSSPSGSRASSARSRGRAWAEGRRPAETTDGPTTPRPRTRSSEGNHERAGPRRDRAERAGPGPRVGDRVAGSPPSTRGLTTPWRRRTPRAGPSGWRTRATSRPTTSRSCSTSRTSTATSTWTSTETGRRSPSSAPSCSSWWAATARCWTRCRS